MRKKIIFFYGINLLVTLICAMLFGGILGSIQGNEVVLGLLVTMGVQLAPLITAGIYRIKYKPERKYTFGISKWTIWSVLLPTGIVLVASMFLTLFQISYVPTIYTGGILALAIITTIVGCTAEEFGWAGCLQEIGQEKYTPFMSSILTGILWGIWHFFKIPSVGFIGYLLFILSIVLFRMLMGYIYEKSNHSITNMIIFHCFINFTTILALYERECNLLYIFLSLLSLGTLLVLWLKDKAYFQIKVEK